MITEIIIFIGGLFAGWITAFAGIILYAKYFKTKIFNALKEQGFAGIDQNKLQVIMKPDNPEDSYEPPIETNEEPVEKNGKIKCVDCGKTFKNKGNLAMHNKWKHGVK
jgi:hypothetical protein